MNVKSRCKAWLQSAIGIENYLHMHRRYTLALASFHFTRFLPYYRNKFADLDLMLSLVAPGDICVDVGANLGVYSVKLAEAVGETGRVFSFEPVSLNYQTLVEGIPSKLMSRIATERLILSEHPGEMGVCLSQRDGAYQSGFCRVVDDRQEDGPIETLKATNLDTYFEGYRDRIAFIKCDVENHELEVLKGARGILETHAPKLLLELWDNAKFDPAFQLLEDLGYLAYHAEKGALKAIDKAQTGWRQKNDYFFIKVAAKTRRVKASMGDKTSAGNSIQQPQ
jgi:FkbM family methyltransferase